MSATATRPARQRTKLQQITSFLAHRRFALLGVSHNSHDLTRDLMRQLQQRGYEVVPVNPHLDEVEGRKCFARVQHIQPPVPAAMLFVAPEITERVLKDCTEAGIKQIWIRAGLDRVPAGALTYARDCGMDMVAGECPLMFLPGTMWFHQLHAFGRKLTGRYPR